VTEAPLSEQNIRQYLLGELSEQEQVEIEDRAFDDQRVLEQILGVEQDLIDDYVSGDIPEERRQSFQQHFLASAERRKKIAFAKALATVVNEIPSPTTDVATTPTWLTKLAAFFTSPATAYSFAVASLLLLFVGSWLFIDRIRLRSEIAQLRTAQESQTAQNRQLEKDLANERLQNQELIANRGTPPQQTPTPEIQPQSTQQPTTPTSPVVVALSLLPGISRGSNSLPKLAIAKDVSLVRLQIGIDPHESYRRYRVELRTENGRQVLAQGNLSARLGSHGQSIPLSVPASAIGTGRYELSLKGITESGTTEDVGFYYFDVVKK
jgi:murein DD-endopeptidase MepM/ murein hydrolase activator NlpD